MSEGVMRVTASEKTELLAQRARLHVQIEGETFVLGNAALTRSREVAEMVGRLREFGLQDEDIQVASVYSKTQSGLLGKSSRAVFKLRIAVSDLDKLPDYMGVLTSQKNLELERLEWLYDEDAALLELSSKAIAKAHAKAQAMAGAIGYQVTGIRSCSDSNELPQTADLYFHGAAAAPARSRAQSAPLEVGTEFKASKEVGSSVTVEFTVAKI